MSSVPVPGGRLPRVVKSLGVVSFFNDFASEMVYPLLPALMTRTLGGGAVALGLLDGISDAVSSGVRLGAGWLADHPRWRRPLIVGGYLIAALTRPVIGAASTAWHVIALRGADRVGKGLRNPPRDAVIADATPPPMRGRAFGYHRGMDHAGAVVGPLLATGLLAAGVGPEGVIRWSLVPGVVAVVAVVWALRGKGEEEREKGGTSDEGRETSATVPPTRAPGAGAVFVLVIGFAFARFPETLLILRLQDLGLPVAAVPLLWAGLHVIRTAASYPGGRLSDAVGPRMAMLAGWVVYSGVCAGLAAAGSAAGAMGWFLAFGLVAALTESPERAFVAEAGVAARVGRRFGAFHGGAGLAALASGVLFGWLYQRSGGPAALYASATVAAVLGLCLVITGTGARLSDG